MILIFRRWLVTSPRAGGGGWSNFISSTSFWLSYRMTSADFFFQGALASTGNGVRGGGGEAYRSTIEYQRCICTGMYST